MGIKIFKTHLNKSGTEFTIDRGVDKKTGKEEEIIRSPMTALDGVGLKAVDNIIANRPYKSLEDFMRRTERRAVNARVFKALVGCGSMDEALPESREVLLASYEDVKKKVEKEKKALKKQEEKIEEESNCAGEVFEISPDNIKI